MRKNFTIKEAYSYSPSMKPSMKPSYSPSMRPSYSPSMRPSIPPSYPPSIPPSFPPSIPPSYPPSIPPSYPPSYPPSIPPSFPPSFTPIPIGSMSPLGTIIKHAPTTNTTITIAANDKKSIGFITLDPGTWFIDASITVISATNMKKCGIYIASDESLSDIFTSYSNVYNSFSTTTVSKPFQLKIYYIIKLETPTNIYYGGSSDVLINLSDGTNWTHLFAIKLGQMEQKTNLTESMTLTTNQNLTIGTVNNITTGNLFLILSSANLATTTSVSMNSITNSFLSKSFITNIYNNFTIPTNSLFSNTYLRIETINDTAISNTITVNYSSGTIKVSPDPKLSYYAIMNIPYQSILESSILALSIKVAEPDGNINGGSRTSFGQLTLGIGKWLLLSSARFSCTNSSNTNFSTIKMMGIMFVPNISCMGTIAHFFTCCNFKMITTDSQDIFLSHIYENSTPNQIMSTCLEIHTDAATITMSTDPRYTYFKAIRVA